MDAVSPTMKEAAVSTGQRRFLSWIIGTCLGAGAKRKLKRWLLDRYFRWEALAAEREDIEADFWPLHDACKPFTLTSAERLYALYKTVEYLTRQQIPGDFVECGVWKGGSVMMMALALQKFGDMTRRIHCFDTFEGMTAPTEFDVHRDTKESASVTLARSERREDNLWVIAPLEVVQRNMAGTGYPTDLVTYHRGKVEDTVPGSAPGQIALLRLDTDWYESTKHELIHLYPPLVRGGILIIDDYGEWQGARKAVDEFLGETKPRLFLSRIDQTGRVAVKLD